MNTTLNNTGLNDPPIDYVLIYVSQYTEFIETKLDIQARSFQVVDDVLNMTNTIDDKVSGIDDTHHEITGKYIYF